MLLGGRSSADVRKSLRSYKRREEIGQSTSLNSAVVLMSADLVVLKASLFGATGCARGDLRCDWVRGARRSLWREAVVGLGPTPSSVEAWARLTGSVLPSLVAVAPHAHSSYRSG